MKKNGRSAVHAQVGSRVRWAKDRTSGKGVIKKILVPPKYPHPGTYLVACDDHIDRELNDKYLRHLVNKT